MSNRSTDGHEWCTAAFDESIHGRIVNQALVRVLRSIALLSGAGAIASCADAHAQQVTPRPLPGIVFAMRPCPAARPASGEPCQNVVGTARGTFTCRYGITQCECRGSSRETARIRCFAPPDPRPNRGPLPPPELSLEA